MISQTRNILLSAGAAAVLTFSAVVAHAEDAVSLASPKYGTWGFDLSGMDRSVKPGEDFDRFANGKWAERTAIPEDRPRYGNFDALAALSERRLHAILEDAAAGRLKDPDAGKIAAGYASFMDEALVEKLDAKPIAPALAEIRKVRTKNDFTSLMGKSNASWFSSILPVYVGIDSKASTRYAVYVGTKGLGLPDRDYYLQAGFAEKKAKYEAYVAAILALAGWESPEASAKAIVAFETRIAEVTWTKTQSRDRDKTYNPKTIAQLNALTPGFDWDRYLAATGLPKLDRIVVTTDTAFAPLAKIYAETPLSTLKAWQAFNVVDGAAPYLSKRFVDARFEFRGKVINGQAEQRLRWKRASAFMDGAMGESLGRLYVARYFPPEAKTKIDDLVGNIRSALETRIQALDWMGPATRAKALEKLSKLTVKIGYPETWRDYSTLTLNREDLVGNAGRTGEFAWRRSLTKLSGPVDKAEWVYPPQTVNAYYYPPNNEIAFMAAILQPPFFDPDADPAVNYGGIGAIIGHEIIHGFDDQGRKSNGDGVLSDWWTADDSAKFKVQAERLGAQYSAFEPYPGLKIQGELTMGENIGDSGGLLLALDAYHTSLKGQPAPVLDGLTGDQRLFLGFAQNWREKAKEAFNRQIIVSDVHAPANFRLIGTVRNVPGWYQAWDIQPGDKLYVAPDQRVKIW